jgi:clan AA aspartic protease (TIGR02281 family)
LEWAEFSDPFNEISVSVQEVHEKGRITEIVIAESAQAPGIFFQEEKVVGWTFGDSVNLGYVWRGIEGEELIEELRIDDFYRTTFANSREEKFVKALAMRDALAAEQLEAITNAFRYESVLASKQTPEYLKPEIIIKRMHELNLQLIDKGFVSTVADAYDVEILSAAADASILVQVTQANIQAYGYESALDIFEAVQKEYRDSGLTQSSELQNLHLKLYHRWLASLVAGGQTNQGKQVYERGRSEFPLDLRLYLYAVELVLMEGDWVEAQQLLDSREYPASLLKIVEELKTQIASQKSENEKIVIRFAPRSRNIFVDATIGDSVIQRFIVDTGASIVTVPSSTVNSLGISGDYNKLERKVYTVGGVTQAPQVVLPSIELNNWTEYNIKALVINLPGQPGYGLLGLNYLRRFQMDINYDDGVLILKPR